jgi:hypothetical protein
VEDSTLRLLLERSSTSSGRTFILFFLYQLIKIFGENSILIKGVGNISMRIGIS